MRYVVKRGEKGWMVWDTTTGTCATIHDVPMDELSESLAKSFMDRLNEEKPPNGSDDSTRH
jgi:hypothetical protein